jgi:hypothetical protein
MDSMNPDGEAKPEWFDAYVPKILRYLKKIMEPLQFENVL